MRGSSDDDEDYVELDDPNEGLFNRLIIACVGLASLFLAWIIIVCICKKGKTCFKKSDKKNVSANEDQAKGYKFRERSDQIVRESRPASIKESNVYQKEQELTAPAFNTAQ